MEGLSQICLRIRELREEAGLTEEQVAAHVGVTPAEYHEYESGGDKAAPFSFYYKLAEFNKLDVSSLISGESPNLSYYTITRKGEGFSLARRPGFSYLHQAIHLKDRQGEPFIVTAPYKGEDEELKFSTHSGQEFILIIKGTLKAALKDKSEILHEGHTIYFDAR